MDSSMIRPVNWRAFFAGHAEHYMKNGFVAWTNAEVTFIERLFQLPRGSRILDMGCGTGRHSVELASRGYSVTGVDVSPEMLAQARAAADRARVPVTFIEADATLFSSEPVFDAAICLCEGGVGLVNEDEEPISHDLAIFRNVHRSLKPGSPFLLTALNGYAIIRRMTDDLVLKGAFDPATMTAQYLDEMDLPEGKQTLLIRERLLIPPEMTAMLQTAGFDVEHVWGGTAGDWGRRPVKLDEIEAMYMCRKRSAAV